MIIFTLFLLFQSRFCRPINYVDVNFITITFAVGHTAASTPDSRQISEVKRRKARLVLG